jgi:tetratricopeptide (TPR) repeat protein
MPSLIEAHWKHANLYLSVAEGADRLFSKKSSKVIGIAIFDQNHEQIDGALEWVTLQTTNDQIDILLARFIDAVSAIGMIRYSVREILIPLNERKIAAVQRLGLKDLEADSFDELGILYAYLGYLQQALHYFEFAYEIVNQIGSKELKRDINTHIRLAQKQLKTKGVPPSAKIPDLPRLYLLRLRFLFAHINKNPFTLIAMHNGIANIYLDLGKWDLAIQNYQQAILISKNYSYRFGELQASVGLLQAELSKDQGRGESFTNSTVSDLTSGFEWSTDFSVFESLPEIAPAIKRVETIAGQLAKNNDPNASEMYKSLDQIMLRTNEIVSAVNENPTHKHEIFINALKSIKENLAYIVSLPSNRNP